MRVITNKFMAWLMVQTRLMRYLIVALLFHVALAAMLGSIKIVAVLPKIVAAFDSAALPTALTEPDDPYAAYRDFSYNNTSLAEKSPTVPAGYQAHIQAPSPQADPATVAEVIGIQSAEATEIARPTGGMASIGPSFSAGDLKVGVPAIKGPGAALLGARMGGQKSSVAIKQFGITQQVEAAILNGLRWLKANQQPNGSWKLDRSVTAGTALGILCYLGHGDTPDTKEFGPTVTKALEYLISTIQTNGIVKDNNMYVQGLAMLALAEAYTMTASPALLNPLERATKATIAAQNVPKKNPQHIGGWRYTPTHDSSDTSATGWVIMGLKSAKNAGVDVPSAVFDKATQFLWNMHTEKGFGYEKPDAAPGPTAVAVLCLQFLGHGNDRRLRPVLEAMRERRVDWTKQEGRWNLYTWYYATQAMFQAGDPFWPSWNSHFRDQFVQNQAKDGHWDAPTNSGEEDALGPIYNTTLAILSLEVYYRYLPLYQILEQQKGAPVLQPGLAK